MKMQNRVKNMKIVKNFHIIVKLYNIIYEDRKCYLDYVKVKNIGLFVRGQSQKKQTSENFVSEFPVAFDYYNKDLKISVRAYYFIIKSITRNFGVTKFRSKGSPKFQNDRNFGIVKFFGNLIFYIFF